MVYIDNFYPIISINPNFGFASCLTDGSKRGQVPFPTIFLQRITDHKDDQLGQGAYFKGRSMGLEREFMVKAVEFMRSWRKQERLFAFRID